MTLSLMASSLLTLWGCDGPPSREYAFMVRVQSQPGRAVEGAAVLVAGETFGVTNVQGTLSVKARGKEGDSVPVEVRCPEGHRSPASPLFVPLRRILDDGVMPEFEVMCARTARSVIVALRAEGGPHLPVRFLGRELSRTDASGAAHVMLEVAPDDVLELSLDTAAQPELRPISPVIRVQPGAGDEVLAVSQVFTRTQQKTVFSPKRRGPVRIE